MLAEIQSNASFVLRYAASVPPAAKTRAPFRRRVLATGDARPISEPRDRQSRRMRKPENSFVKGAWAGLGKRLGGLCKVPLASGRGWTAELPFQQNHSLLILSPLTLPAHLPRPHRACAFTVH
jgi:hypothetical protein